MQRRKVRDWLTYTGNKCFMCENKDTEEHPVVVYRGKQGKGGEVHICDWCLCTFIQRASLLQNSKVSYLPLVFGNKKLVDLPKQHIEVSAT